MCHAEPVNCCSGIHVRLWVSPQPLDPLSPIDIPLSSSPALIGCPARTEGNPDGTKWLIDRGSFGVSVAWRLGEAFLARGEAEGNALDRGFRRDGARFSLSDCFNVPSSLPVTTAQNARLPTPSSPPITASFEPLDHIYSARLTLAREIPLHLLFSSPLLLFLQFDACRVWSDDSCVRDGKTRAVARYAFFIVARRATSLAPSSVTRRLSALSALSKLALAPAAKACDTCRSCSAFAARAF